MDVFVEQLAALCREHVTRNKWVFVPSHALGHTLGERVALGGTNWLNLRFVTPLDVALRMGAPFLVERGIEPSEEGLGPALIMRLMLDLPRDGGYFRPLADQPTLAEALWTTVRELRMAGIKSDQLSADAFASPEKHAELRALLASYEQFLTVNNRGDMALVYEEALKHTDWCPIQPKDCWTELPDVVWNPLPRRLMDAMPGERIAPNALDIPGVSLPRRMRTANVPRVAPTSRISPLAFLLAQETDPGPRIADREKRSASDSERVALFHAGGREAEVEEVFRRILATGVPLDQVEIACASDAHVSLIWEKALRHSWPVTLGPGIAAPSTRPGRALLGFCDWIETDFSAGHLRRLLQSGDTGIDEEDEGFTAGQAARTLARADAGWGRATYSLSLGLLAKSYETRAGDPELSDDEREAAESEGEADTQHRQLDNRAHRAGARGVISRQGAAAGRRRGRAGVRRTLDRSRQPARLPRCCCDRRPREGVARPRGIRVLAPRGAALHPRMCRIPAGGGGASTSRPPPCLPASADGILRPAASLCRWSRRRPGLPNSIRGSGPAGLGARRHLAGVASFERQDRRSRVWRARPSGRLG